MTDIFTPEKRSWLMSRIKGKETSLERLVYAHLRKEGIYFQKRYKKIDGSPDVALPRKKRVVFIDGDFWHGWKFAQKSPRWPEAWRLKISQNIRRDRRQRAGLKRQGWSVMRIRERELKREKLRTLERIATFLIDG